MITVQGAREHNLKGVNLQIPRNKLVVFSGVSGSGKSSLAFDTLYAEGQRRYVESLSAYARQFLGQMEKPKVDYIGGLSPAIAIEQKAVSKNPRSTVGTVTEVYDYLRVLFARIGVPHCYNCGREVRPQSSQQIIERILQQPPQTRFQLLAPIATGRKGTFEETLTQARADGFVRARIDGVVTELDQRLKLAKNKKHDIELVIDRLVIPVEPDPDFRTRLADSVETALRWGEGIVAVDVIEGEEFILSEKNACPHCGLSFPELTPTLFSFNSPLGMCPDCNGLGTRFEFDETLFVNPVVSINDGAVIPWGAIGKKESWATQIAQQIATRFQISLDTVWQELPAEIRDLILNGNPDIKFTYQSANFTGNWPYEGVIKSTQRRYKETQSEGMREYYARYLSQQPCTTCRGERLRPEAAAVTVGGLKVPQFMALSVAEAYAWVEQVMGAGSVLSAQEQEIATELFKEIRDRLKFMLDVGLHYLTLDRPAPSLSGGEGQRIRLASQIGSGLVGVMYVLDEPSIGLHQRDNQRLLSSLLRLRDLGNTVIVVEHDSDTMEAADWVVDFGPGAGIRGGEVVFAGTPAEIKQAADSVTGQYLSGRQQVTSPTGRRDPTGRSLTLHDPTLR